MARKKKEPLPPLPEFVLKKTATKLQLYGPYLGPDSCGLGVQDYTMAIPLAKGLRIVDDRVLAKALQDARDEASAPLLARIMLLEDHLHELAEGARSKARLIQSNSPTSKYIDPADVLFALANEAEGPSLVTRRNEDEPMSPES